MPLSPGHPSPLLYALSIQTTISVLAFFKNLHYCPFCTGSERVSVKKYRRSFAGYDTSGVVAGYKVFTAVTMKNVVFWDIRTQFVLHRRLITSPLDSPAS
jgi:transposase-like protein